jgi:homoserine dehydrogenase
VRTDALGEVTIVGPGAGRAQTGFAMLSDLVHIGRRS